MPVLSKYSPRPRSVEAVQMEPERLQRKGFVEKQSGVKGRENDMIVTAKTGGEI